MKRESDGSPEDNSIMQESEDTSVNEAGDNENTKNEDTDHNFENNEYFSPNTNQDNGPTNPPKRQRLSDDEEIRLLIPSKVNN